MMVLLLAPVHKGQYFLIKKTQNKTNKTTGALCVSKDTRKGKCREYLGELEKEEMERCHVIKPCLISLTCRSPDAVIREGTTLGGKEFQSTQNSRRSWLQDLLKDIVF